MHKVGISREAMELIERRRGRLRLYPELDLNRLALVVIDMQNCFVAPGGALEVPIARNIVPNINRLASACRRRGVPVIWVHHVLPSGEGSWKLFLDHFVTGEMKEKALSHLTEGWGTEFWKELEIKEGDYIVEKTRYSALIPGSSELERLLRGLGKDTIIITGTRTSICCESTARDAMMLDFKVIFVSDATATFTDQEHQATLNIMAMSFADVVTTEELVRQIEAS